MMDSRTCAEWRELMTDALAGVPHESESRRLERHLDACETCAEEMRTLAAVWEGLAELPSPQDRPDARAELIERAHGQQTGSGTMGSGARVYRMLRQAAVVVIVFAGGLVAGRMWESSGDEGAGAPESVGTRYLLMLHENESFDGPPVSQAVAEYSEWAGGIAADGRLAAAEKLTDDAGFWLTGPDGRRLETGDGGAAGDALPADRPPSAEAVAGRATGFFIITAPTDAAAERIAATMPHLGYGGSVQIREIEDVGD